MARHFIVEADGGSRGNPGPSAYGSVVIDGATGEVIAQLAEYLGVATNNFAEYSGAIAGLRHAAEVDSEASVEVRLDSRLVVEQMSGRWQIKHADMRELAKQARAAFPPAQVTYTWVPREQNRRADALVNAALDAVAAGVSGRLTTAAMDVIGEAEEQQVRATIEDATRPRNLMSDATRPRNRMVGWADLGTPTVTVLARHGATAMSVDKRFSGLGGSDPALSRLGEEQAMALAAELVARGGIERIVSSPLQRTMQTAAIASASLNLSVDVDDGLAECNFGEWDGLTFTEVRERWPDELDAWLASADVSAPGGESFNDVRARVLAARDRILKDSAGQTVLVVAHVTPIKAMVTDALDAPLHSIYRMELAPCSLTTLSWFADGNASMFGFAEAAHLRHIVAPTGI
ncbi:MAG: bifunctional RNase H/acid phosphatase [Candidatus Nanopelagicales bacterium]|nr:bifunctional RNase H/acid phosphatase [Candidatus Nanopelagicales bacterium]